MTGRVGEYTKGKKVNQSGSELRLVVIFANHLGPRGSYGDTSELCNGGIMVIVYFPA